MASKVTDEERDERVLLVGEYVKETGASTRETAKYFTRTYFNISNSTVSDYLHRYIKMKPNEVDAIKDKIDINTAKSVEDNEIKKRVLSNAKYFLSGMSINEISEMTGESFWTIYRDLTRRIKLLDEDASKEIKNKLEDNRKSNLVHVK